MIPLKDDNPTSTLPVVTVALLAANILAFLYELSLPREQLPAFIQQMGLVPMQVTTRLGLGDFVPPLSLFTSMFLHGGVMHLAGNMLYLWIFGNNIEEAAGHIGFIVFYLVCGVAAAATQVAVYPSSAVPMVGASGAIAGVLGAYMLLFPHARVLTLVPVFFIMRLIYLPAGLMLGLWFVYQLLLSGATPGGGGGVAFFAHIGGFVAGMGLIWVFRGPRAMRRMRSRGPARLSGDEDDQRGGWRL